MKYRMIGDVMPAVEMTLQPGEKVYTQSGGMAWMSDGFELDSNMRGGLGKSLARMFTGESVFMASYRATMPDSKIGFAATVPGDILPVDVTTQSGIICQKSAFLCAEDNVSLNTVFSKKLSTGLFGGEGFILQELTGSGMAFLEADGDVVEFELAPGEVMKVDTGNLVAFEKTVDYDIEMIKGLKNMMFGGEGMFLTRMTGPGKIYVQTMNYMDFAGRIIAMVPSKS